MENGILETTHDDIRTQQHKENKKKGENGFHSKLKFLIQIDQKKILIDLISNGRQRKWFIYYLLHIFICLRCLGQYEKTCSMHA